MNIWQPRLSLARLFIILIMSILPDYKSSQTTFSVMNESLWLDWVSQLSFCWKFFSSILCCISQARLRVIIHQCESTVWCLFQRCIFRSELTLEVNNWPASRRRGTGVDKLQVLLARLDLSCPHCSCDMKLFILVDSLILYVLMSSLLLSQLLICPCISWYVPISPHIQNLPQFSSQYQKTLI